MKWGLDCWVVLLQCSSAGAVAMGDSAALRKIALGSVPWVCVSVNVSGCLSLPPVHPSIRPP